MVSASPKPTRTAAHPPAAGVEVGVCVPFPFLTQARAVLEGTAIGWGAQNVSPFGAGAYTGEEIGRAHV